MKRYYAAAFVPLLVALYIYILYRTPLTVINQLIISIAGEPRFIAARRVWAYIALPEFAVYSLPEALWVFCATLLSKNLFFTVRNRVVRCTFLPLCFALLWEIFQSAGVTFGYFDGVDLLLCAIAAVLGAAFLRPPYAPIHIFRTLNMQVVLFYAVFLVVYLSHVQRE